MILADKIIELRRRNDWTQDDLAERLNVSRQSVSKWEGGQAAPTLDKIVEMSRLFGVSTDTLLKDELELEFSETPSAMDPPEPARRLVTLEEAGEFLAAKARTAKPMACGVFLCILSPICMLFLIGVSQTWLFPFSQEWAVGAGLLVLFLFIIPAVAMFVYCGMKTSKFEYMEKEVFDTAYGVEQMARERMEQARERHTKFNVLGICLCVASAIPTLVGAFTYSEFFLMFGVCATLAVAAMGVWFILLASIPWNSYQILLQEGDYAPERKTSLVQTVTVIYWCLVTAGYLWYNFSTNNWHRSWIVWPVAGVLYAGLIALLAAHGKRKQQ